MNNVRSIAEKSDHIEIATSDGNIHIIPVAAFRHVASGKLTVNRIHDFIPIYQQITKQWLELKGL